MRQWLDKLDRKMTRFMLGRYGQDSLNAALCILALLLIFVAAFVPGRWPSLTALLPLGWATFRVYSKNLAKRREENAKWLKLTAPIRKSWRLRRTKWADRKSYRYFICPRCRETMRVPRGKGKIEITCRKCGARFQRKT